MARSRQQQERTELMQAKGSPVAFPTQCTSSQQNIRQAQNFLNLAINLILAESSARNRSNTVASPAVQGLQDETFSRQEAANFMKQVKTKFAEILAATNAGLNKSAKPAMDYTLDLVQTEGNAILIKIKQDEKVLAMINFSDLPVEGFRNLCALRANDQTKNFVVPVYYAKTFNLADADWTNSYRTLTMMAYCEGGQLDNYMENLRNTANKATYSTQAFNVVYKLLEAYAAFNKLGIHLRDTKPENLLLTTEGHLLLHDFKSLVKEGELYPGSRLYDDALNITKNTPLAVTERKLLGLALYLALTGKKIDNASAFAVPDDLQLTKLDQYDPQYTAAFKEILNNLMFGSPDITITSVFESCTRKQLQQPVSSTESTLSSPPKAQDQIPPHTTHSPTGMK